jgi:hypothetical protein
MPIVDMDLTWLAGTCRYVQVAIRLNVSTTSGFEHIEPLSKQARHQLSHLSLFKVHCQLSEEHNINSFSLPLIDGKAIFDLALNVSRFP